MKIIIIVIIMLMFGFNLIIAEKAGGPIACLVVSLFIMGGILSLMKIDPDDFNSLNAGVQIAIAFVSILPFGIYTSINATPLIDKRKQKRRNNQRQEIEKAIALEKNSLNEYKRSLGYIISINCLLDLLNNCGGDVDGILNDPNNNRIKEINRFINEKEGIILKLEEKRSAIK